MFIASFVVAQDSAPIAPTLDLERIRQATVFILQARSIGDTLDITCFSSGTIVSRDGLILTNAHATIPSPACPGDELVVALTVTPEAPPIPRYRAVVIQSNPGLDLALLRIDRELDGRLIPEDALALPFVETDDSSTVALDDTITIVGYPGIANDPTAVQTATVVTFLAEPVGGERSWMKSSLEIPASMSGGGAYNRAGRLIAIPTTAPVSAARPGSTCVTLQDSNRDNLINADDTCIPVGGRISTLRPANFARPLIRAAQLGLELENLSERSVNTIAAAPQPNFRRLFFSPSVNEAGMPTQVIRTLPAGSTSLYLFFDYAGMTPETVFELRVTTDGIPNTTFSLSPVRWGGGARGIWYIGSTGQPYPNGDYEFTLLADGIPLESARLTVGGAPDTSPQFSDIIFGSINNEGNVSGNGFVLPVGPIANALFLYRNMTDGMSWAALWYYEGTEIARTETTWADGVSGTKDISIQEPNGLLPGTYRLELYIDDRLSTTADFTMAGAQQGVLPQVFFDSRFTSAETPAEAASTPAITTFSSGVNTTYTVFNWRSLLPGTLWTARWTVDGNLLFEQTIPWSQSTDGANYLYRLSGTRGIPDGTYALELYLGPLRLARTEARVGIGQLPIDPFAQTDGIQMRGQILDADTGAGIPGVSFILISELFSVADFLQRWDNDMVYALAVTDRIGRFQIDRPLSFDAPYSVYIAADGYLPIEADGVAIAPEDLPIDLTIYLTRG
ncbi:MAG: serine protease [Chloroflexota bacterium]|nr:serine protease [Chloroflexota bacterium]